MAPDLLVVVDLGDALTKGVAVSVAGEMRRFRFPSVVARRLLEKTSGGTTGELVLDDAGPLRPSDFDARGYPRGRSYPGAALTRGRVLAPPRARFAGWMATTMGADRQLLGLYPSDENIEALVNKAFLELSVGKASVRLVFVVDGGRKLPATQRYVDATPRHVRFLSWSAGRDEPSRVELAVRGEIVDAPNAARAMLPAQPMLADPERVLVVDIGYLRTKLAVLSEHGCDHQEEIEDVGVADCVRRVLRDGQELGLIEDEFAVIKALEQSQELVQIAGRRYEVAQILDSARRGLEQEVTRAVERLMRAQSARLGTPIRSVMLIGGGSAVVGGAIRDGLRASKLGLRRVLVARDPSYFLAEGAARLCDRRVTASSENG